MNLTKLFEAQKALDKRIIEEKGLHGQDLIPQKVVALIAELGECANEWRGFKFWSEDREPRNYCKQCMFIETPHEHSNPLLEEYVDCLHFLLSIGLDLEINENLTIEGIPQHTDIILSFSKINRYVSKLDWEIRDSDIRAGVSWYHAVANFVRLGELFGFTWEQVEKAYFQKNQVNHKRQEEHY